MRRPYVELIAAVGPRWELGNQGGMPWGRIKGDLALFRRITEGKAVIMGRRTWESLPPAHRPPLERLNMILTRDKAWALAQPEMPWVLYPGHERWGDCYDHNRVRAAIAQARSPVWGKSGVAIIGGGEVYRAALEADLVDVVHLSVIHHPEGWAHDVAFPALSAAGWVVAERFQRPAEDGAPHGWTQMRLVRDPSHPALDGAPLALEVAR